MALIVVERSSGEPLDPKTFHAREREILSTRQELVVRRLVSYASADGHPLVCIYEAPDTDRVRALQSEAALPWHALWDAKPCGSGQLVTTRDGLETVAVTRVHETPTTTAEVLNRARQVGGCLSLYRVTTRTSLLSSDGLRQLCLFVAPDAEAVRVANRASSLAFERAFKATIYVPEEGVVSARA